MLLLRYSYYLKIEDNLNSQNRKSLLVGRELLLNLSTRLLNRLSNVPEITTYVAKSKINSGMNTVLCKNIPFLCTVIPQKVVRPSFPTLGF